MMDERLEKLFGNLPTEDFYLIRQTFGISALASLGVTVISSNPIIDCSFLILYALNYFGFVNMRQYNALDFTKGYDAIKEDYRLFLSNYRDLMKSLDMDSLASICASFYYLYKNGYLSIMGKFESRSADFFEGRKYQLANIFNGCGICRHTANSLKDILNFCGYPTAALPVYTRKYENYTIEDIENVKKYIEKSFEDIEGDERVRKFAVEAFLNAEVLTHQFIVNNENSQTVSKAKKRLEKKVGNHLILLTSDGNKRITYDSTDNCFYGFPTEQSIDIVNEYGLRVEARFKKLNVINTPSQEKILWKNLKLEPMNLEGLREAQEETEKRLENNLDIVESFQKENMPLMRDLKNRIYDLKSR